MLTSIRGVLMVFEGWRARVVQTRESEREGMRDEGCTYVCYGIGQFQMVTSPNWAIEFRA